MALCLQIHMQNLLSSKNGNCLELHMNMCMYIICIHHKYTGMCVQLCIARDKVQWVNISKQ